MKQIRMFLLAVIIMLTTATTSMGNTAPVADAGEDQIVSTASKVKLDGKASYDADKKDKLTYSWSFISKPAGSTAILSKPTKEKTKFTVDTDGLYIIQLIVNDGTVGSDPDYVTVHVGPDTTAPVITLNGDNPMEVTQDDTFIDPGATATDDRDGDISGLIVIDSSTVDTSTAGIYTVTYDVIDSSGNAAATVTRTVVVENPPSGPLVAILVDPSIETAIQDELLVFVSDLSNDGFSSIIHSVTESTPPELRSYLQGLYNDSALDLVGAILIGSVPTPRYYIFYPADGHPQRGPFTGASYQYYEDLDGDFQLLDESQWLYDGHTGDVETEIWISVLPPLATDSETISANQRYFFKNHRYRLGLERPDAGYLHPIIGAQLETEESYNNQVDYVLGLTPGSYQYSWGPLTSRGNILVAPNNLLNDPVNFPGSDEVFYQEIQTGDYDILITSAHGSAYGIGSNGYWYDRSYLNNNSIDVTFWFEGGCSTVDLDVIPSFGVTALYSETSSILAYRGATMPQGGLGGSSNGLYSLVIGTALLNGKSIGEAILEHRSVPLAENYASQQEYFTAQHILLGDGTLRLQEYLPYETNSDWPLTGRSK